MHTLPSRRSPRPTRALAHRWRRESLLRREALRIGTALLTLGFLSCGGPSQPKPVARNLLLITIDTLRADRLGAWGYERPTSPTLDALAAESVVFENAQVQSAWTLPSLASLMTSLYSSTHGAWTFDSRLGESFTTLAERLGEAGYASHGVASHVFLAERYGLQQGFDGFDVDLVTDFVASHEAITSEQVSERGIAWLETRSADPRPWFLWVHYFDPHASYRSHEGISERFGTRSDSERYDGEIAFTDRAIGRLLAALEERGLAEGTIVTVVADHGEEFGEHGGEGHGRTLHREILHVPLTIRAPGYAARQVEQRVASVDLLPTWLELLGLDPPEVSAGRSLVPAMRGGDLGDEPILAELALNPNNPIDSVSSGGWKLIRQRSTGRSLLFDLVSDPAEREDLAAQKPEVAAQLLSQLDGEIERARKLATNFETSSPVDLSPEDLERLRALGYVDPP